MEHPLWKTRKSLEKPGKFSSIHRAGYRITEVKYRQGFCISATLFHAGLLMIF
jgi:hypothetical protein